MSDAEGDTKGGELDEAPAAAEDNHENQGGEKPNDPPPEEEDALDIRAEDVDFLDEEPEDDYNPNQPPVKPLGAAALWGQENNEPNYKAGFKEVGKVTRRLYKRQAASLREKYEAHLDRYMSENPGWDPREAKKAKKRARAGPRKSTRKKKKKKLKKKEEPVDEEQQMLDDELFPNEMDMQEEEELGGIEPSVYDKTVMALKSRPKKRRKGQDDEDLNNELEAYGKQFIAEMVEAAKTDREGVMMKPPRPAIACFKMVKKLQENTKRAKLFRLMLENNLLCAFRDWMQPYPNGMLPLRQLRDQLYNILTRCKLQNFGDIKEFFEASQQRTDEAIQRREITPDTVGFCKTMLQLWKNPKESKINKRKIAQMIHQWVRPLLDARISFKDICDAPEDPMSLSKQEALDAQKRPQLVPDSKRTRARVPERPWFSFGRAPQQKDIEKKEKAVNFKRKSIEKRFKKINSDRSVGGCQAAHVSITGRGKH